MRAYTQAYSPAGMLDGAADAGSSHNGWSPARLHFSTDFARNHVELQKRMLSSASSDKIILQGLVFHGYHGVLPEVLWLLLYEVVGGEGWVNV